MGVVSSTYGKTSQSTWSKVYGTPSSNNQPPKTPTPALASSGTPKNAEEIITEWRTGGGDYQQLKVIAEREASKKIVTGGGSSTTIAEGTVITPNQQSATNVVAIEVAKKEIAMTPEFRALAERRQREELSKITKETKAEASFMGGAITGYSTITPPTEPEKKVESLQLYEPYTIPKYLTSSDVANIPTVAGTTRTDLGKLELNVPKEQPFNQMNAEYSKPIGKFLISNLEIGKYFAKKDITEAKGIDKFSATLEASTKIGTTIEGENKYLGAGLVFIGSLSKSAYELSPVGISANLYQKGVLGTLEAYNPVNVITAIKEGTFFKSQQPLSQVAEASGIIIGSEIGIKTSRSFFDLFNEKIIERGQKAYSDYKFNKWEDSIAKAEYNQYPEVIIKGDLLRDTVSVSKTEPVPSFEVTEVVNGAIQKDIQRQFNKGTSTPKPETSLRLEPSNNLVTERLDKMFTDLTPTEIKFTGDYFGDRIRNIEEVPKTFSLGNPFGLKDFETTKRTQNTLELVEPTQRLLNRRLITESGEKVGELFNYGDKIDGKGSTRVLSQTFKLSDNYFSSFADWVKKQPIFSSLTGLELMPQYVYDKWTYTNKKISLSEDVTINTGKPSIIQSLEITPIFYEDLLNEPFKESIYTPKKRLGIGEDYEKEKEQDKEKIKVTYKVNIPKSQSLMTQELLNEPFKPSDYRKANTVENIREQIKEQEKKQENDIILVPVSDIMLYQKPNYDRFKEFKIKIPEDPFKKKELPPIDYDSDYKPTTEFKSKSFLSLVRKEGQFKPIGLYSTSREAFNKAIRNVRNTASASLKVLETDTNKLVEANLSNTEFYKSKREEGVYIQKRNLRITTKGEKLEISYKRGAKHGRRSFR